MYSNNKLKPTKI